MRDGFGCLNMTENSGEIVFYQAEDGRTSLEVQRTDDTVWLSQAQMVELFGKTRIRKPQVLSQGF